MDSDAFNGLGIFMIVTSIAVSIMPFLIFFLLVSIDSRLAKICKILKQEQKKRPAQPLDK